ncbi:MAG: 6-hydroxymethylpterin diphosphokinase MptE-like protein [Mobilitalea sp.]
MDFFEQNMGCLKEYRNKIYLKIQEMTDGSSRNVLTNMETEEAKDGESYLSFHKDGKNYRINSSYSPKHEAEKWVEQFAFLNMNIAITMFGLGTGSFARELLNKKEKNDVLIVYEPSAELFIYVLHHYNLTDLLSSTGMLLVVEGLNESDFHNMLRMCVNITNLYTQIQCTHPYYEELFTESYVEYWKELRDNYYYTIKSINTEISFGERFIENNMRNLKYLRDSVSLKDIKSEIDTEIPAIIVAAGPSMGRNIEALKNAKGKAYIFVVDRILQYVLDQGIEPDFIVTMDPTKPLEYFSDRTDITIPLITVYDANWKILQLHKGKKIIAICFDYLQKIYKQLDKKPEIYDIGTSVATVTFAACRKLGFKTIILVGQDLAFDGESTHAGGSVEKATWAGQNYEIEGVYGTKVTTRHDWYEFLGWFRDMIAAMEDVTVIDAKDRGAKIEGTIVMPLEEALEKYSNHKVPSLEQLDKMTTFNQDEMSEVIVYFEDIYQEISIIKRKVKEAITLCENQVRDFKRNPNETKETRNRYKKLSKINENVESMTIYSMTETLITAKAAHELSKLGQFTEDFDNDKISTYEKSMKVYEAIIESVDYIKPFLKEAIDTI